MPKGPVCNPALEQAIIAATDTAQALAVYGDWLQDQGDVRGEWVALQQRLEESPTDARLKSASIRFLDQQREALLGDAAPHLGAMHVGWRGGFADELRLFGAPSMADENGHAESILATLLEHPSARFVRCVTLGAFADVQLGRGRQGVVDALALSRPVLLSRLMLFEDDEGRDDADAVDLTSLASLPRLESLSLCGARVDLPRLPRLRELSLDVASLGADSLELLAEGAFPELEELTLMVAGVSTSRVLDSLAHVPRLRRLRVIHLRDCDGFIASTRLGALAKQLELLDLSHGDLGTAGIDALDADFAELPMLIAFGGVRANIKRLEARGKRAAVSQHQALVDGYAPLRAWVTGRFESEGRDALRLVPDAGGVLYSVGTRLLAEEPAKAIPYLAASLSLPQQDINISAWSNFSIAQWRSGHFDAAELAAREGLLRFPGDPNLFACLLDPLRKADRLEEGLAEVPAALACIASPPVRRTRLGRPLPERQACLLDCVLTLIEAQKEQAAFDAVERLASSVPPTPRIHAALALAWARLGNEERAKEALMKAEDAEKEALLHVRAVLKARAGRKAEALALVAAMKKGKYPEWHSVAKEPGFAVLRDDARFRALVRPRKPRRRER